METIDLSNQEKYLLKLSLEQVKEDILAGNSDAVEELLAFIIEGKEQATTPIFEFLSENRQELFFTSHPDHSYFRPLSK